MACLSDNTGSPKSLLFGERRSNKAPTAAAFSFISKTPPQTSDVCDDDGADSSSFALFTAIKGLIAM